MGIRFLCPNGHRLNVKSHLAGMRGICPDCEARFVIPAESGSSELQRAEVAPATNGQGPALPVETTLETKPVAPPTPAPVANAVTAPPPPPPLRPSTPAPPPAAATETLPDLWYVNSEGEQFGPANSETFASWVAAGRVPAESMVWRTGWDQWKPGSEVLEEMKLPLVPPVEASVAPLADVAESSTALPAENYHARKRRRRDRAKMMTMTLSALVFLLLVVLVVVLTRD